MVWATTIFHPASVFCGFGVLRSWQVVLLVSVAHDSLFVLEVVNVRSALRADLAHAGRLGIPVSL